MGGSKPPGRGSIPLALAKKQRGSRLTKKQINPWLRNVIEKKARFDDIIQSVRDISSTGGKVAEEARLKGLFLGGANLLQVEELLSAIPKGAKK